VFTRSNGTQVSAFGLDEMETASPDVFRMLIHEARALMDSLDAEVGLSRPPLDDAGIADRDAADLALYCPWGCRLGISGRYDTGVESCPHTGDAVGYDMPGDAAGEAGGGEAAEGLARVDLPAG
jgi:hypothetical protein